MAVTHDDLLPSRRSTELRSKTGLFLIVATILSGLLFFILCLIAESTRSEVRWLSSDGSNSKGQEDQKYECVYTGNGKTPLLCAACAFVGLAIVMVVQHVYILIAVSKSPPPTHISLDPSSTPPTSLTWQTGFFFFSTWVCFAVGEILLLIALGVESGHLKNWSRPKPSCLILRQGLFSAAGVFTLATVFSSAGLYLMALRALRVFKEQENVRREVLEIASSLHFSPPRMSPRVRPMIAFARENPVTSDDHSHYTLSSLLSLSPFTKH